jgi:hypothetical protein
VFHQNVPRRFEQTVGGSSTDNDEIVDARSRISARAFYDGALADLAFMRMRKVVKLRA